MKAIVIVMLLAIIAALIAAGVFLYRDQGHGMRMVTALTIRVGLSIALIVLLIVSYFAGWIGPNGVR